MSPDLGFGLACVLAGGILNGSWVLPMKRLTAWRWENTWLAFSILGLVVLPWTAAAATIPDLAGVLAGTSGATLARVLLFGFGWGIGNILFGLGVRRLGMALAYGIVVGLVASIGTLLPLALLDPGRLRTREGALLLLGTLLVTGGIVCCALAGRRRERDARAGATRVEGGGFLGGLAICVASGVLSSMLNFAFVFGAEIQRASAASGASRAMAANGLWALALGAGFVANGGYAVYLLTRNQTWRVFAAPARSGAYWGGALAMGSLLVGGFLAYGGGATALGSLGGVVGWPLLMSMSLITSNFWSALTGEWRGASPAAYRTSLTGTALLIAAIVVIARSGTL